MSPKIIKFLCELDKFGSISLRTKKRHIENKLIADVLRICFYERHRLSKYL